MKIERFEELPLWQESKILARQIYRITSSPRFKDFSLRDQLRRAAVSIVSNVAEGFERGSNKEFIQFLYVAKGSLGEVRAQRYVGTDNGFIADRDFQEAALHCENLSRQISNFIGYLRKSSITAFHHKVK